MSNIPCIDSYEKLEKFFNIVRDKETPLKFTYRHLARSGFPSSKDRVFVLLLKQLGYIDEKGRVKEDYHSLKDVVQFQGTLRRGIERAYTPLIELDGNAINATENVLNGYFGRLTGESLSRSLVYTRTFKELVRLAGWGKQDEQSIKESIAKEKIVENVRSIPNINLSINLPTTTDEKVYQTLFKHLKELVTPQN